jgi:hypothetical protein
MARHNVYFELPTRELGKVDAKFSIYENDEKLGEITISKSSIEYRPANKQYRVRLFWGQFDRFVKSALPK